MSVQGHSLSWSPLWPHYLAWATTILALSVGLFRYTVLDPWDPLHCNALMNTGRWLDDAHQNWQPDGCMLHTYQTNDAARCLPAGRIIFVGDSFARNLFFQLAHIIDSSLPSSEPDHAHKHADHILQANSALQLSFHWDPFLTSSETHAIITSQEDEEEASVHRPELLVMGSGLWYLRYAESSGGLSAWEATMEATIDAISRSSSELAHQIVLLPVEEVVQSKLSHERASTLRSSDIDAMNSDLSRRVNPPSDNFTHSIFNPRVSQPLFFPTVLNKMLDASQTEDGLHYSDAIARAQANILLNLRCNNVLPKTFPLEKTCCRSYPWPSLLHLIVLGLAVSWGPFIWLRSRRQGNRFGERVIRDDQVHPLVFCAAIAIIYLADRTGLWLKEQKQFDPWMFALLGFLSLALGLGTVQRTDTDLGFLNRDQTNEWKGWMQIAILIYHYLGASQISGIDNPVRVLVASYLFMTGYGHTTFYLREADFGFLRVAQVLVRLNMFTLLLAYTMNTDYIFYYFPPLVSMWYLVTYATMAIGSQFNDRSPFLIIKIFASASIVTWIVREQWLLETVFVSLRTICGIHWSAKEWTFRVGLDLVWIVYFGMLSAFAVVKIREHRLIDHPLWPNVVKVAVFASGIVMAWYFGSELLQTSKFTSNTWDPYISFLAVAAFVVLRNATPALRSSTSRAFSFIGMCWVETFTIQYHLWLAADTKGLLVVLPTARWRPLNFVVTTVMFIYVSYHVAQANRHITTWICSGAQQHLPMAVSHAAAPTRSSVPQVEEAIPMVVQAEERMRKDSDGNVMPPEPDTPIRPVIRWVDRLAEGSARSQPQLRGFQREWRPGIRTKLTVALLLMWAINMMWTYPDALG